MAQAGLVIFSDTDSLNNGQAGLVVTNARTTKENDLDLFAISDDASVANFRALIVSDLPRAEQLAARFADELQDPVLRRFAEAADDEESSPEADAWARAEADQILAEGKWHSADEAKRVLLG